MEYFSISGASAKVMGRSPRDPALDLARRLDGWPVLLAAGGPVLGTVLPLRWQALIRGLRGKLDWGRPDGDEDGPGDTGPQGESGADTALTSATVRAKGCCAAHMSSAPMIQAGVPISAIAIRTSLGPA